MPKIIENVREQLLAEAKKQICERGYANTTIRSVASACGLGIGTVYNYFRSKEMLIAGFVLEDWKVHLCEMRELPTDDPHGLLYGIYDSLVRFAKENETLFSDADAAKHAVIGSGARHRMLRGQIAAFILPICDSELCAEFLAQSLISWSMEGLDFEALYPLLEKNIKK